MLSLTTLALTRAEADAYAAARGRAAWAAATTAARDEALRRGQDYIAGEYNRRWVDEWGNDEAPEAVKFAIIEAAFRELETPNILRPDVTLAEKKILTGVKGITWEPLYRGGGVSAYKPVLTAIDGLLDGLVMGAGTLFLDRA